MTAVSDTESVHATCVAFAGNGVLLRGPAGAGKSDLALRMIQSGATLVAYDRVILRRDGDAVTAVAPPEIAGLLEVRGIGIVRLDHAGGVPVTLIADLVAPPLPERLPRDAWSEYLGTRIRQVSVAPFESSAPAKLRIAVYSSVEKDDPVTGARLWRRDKE